MSIDIKMKKPDTTEKPKNPRNPRKPKVPTDKFGVPLICNKKGPVTPETIKRCRNLKRAIGQ